MMPGSHSFYCSEMGQLLLRARPIEGWSSLTQSTECLKLGNITDSFCGSQTIGSVRSQLIYP